MWPKDARKYGKPYSNQDDDGSPIKEKRNVTGKSSRNKSTKLLNESNSKILCD